MECYALTEGKRLDWLNDTSINEGVARVGKERQEEEISAEVETAAIG